METISIEVPIETAKGWLDVPKVRRNKLANKFREEIENEVKNFQKQKLLEAMNGLASEAKKKWTYP